MKGNCWKRRRKRSAQKCRRVCVTVRVRVCVNWHKREAGIRAKKKERKITMQPLANRRLLSICCTCAAIGFDFTSI